MINRCKFIWLLANRFRLSQKNVGFMGFMAKSSSAGIALGVAVLIFALSVINGFEKQLVERFLAVVPHVEYSAADKPISDWQNKVARLSQEPGVKAAAPVIATNVMAQFRGQLQAAQVRAVEPEYERQVSIVEQFIEQHTLDGLSDNQVLLGRDLATSLNVQVGQTMTLLMVRPNSQQLSAPKRLQVTVAGLIASHSPLDKTMILAPMALMQNALELEKGQVTGLRVALHDVFQAPQLAMKIGQTLDDYVYVQSWVNTQGSLYTDIQMVRTIVYMSLILIIAVAGFNIVSSLFMEVKEKQSAIAILRTMGATNGMIVQSFVTQGMITALKATVIGVILGVALALNATALFDFWVQLKGANTLAGVYFIDFLPSELKFADVLSVVSVVFVISLLSTCYPAVLATRVDPANVLGN